MFVLASYFLYEFSLLDLSHFNKNSERWVAVARSTPGVQTGYFFFLLILRGERVQIILTRLPWLPFLT